MVAPLARLDDRELKKFLADWQNHRVRLSSEDDAGAEAFAQQPLAFRPDAGGAQLQPLQSLQMARARQSPRPGIRDPAIAAQAENAHAIQPQEEAKARTPASLMSLT
jgi:hypothetical protein